MTEAQTWFLIIMLTSPVWLFLSVLLIVLIASPSIWLYEKVKERFF